MGYQMSKVIFIPWIGPTYEADEGSAPCWL